MAQIQAATYTPTYRNRGTVLSVSINIRKPPRSHRFDHYDEFDDGLLDFDYDDIDDIDDSDDGSESEED